jgi:quercetin dioxygenase-like cupin family protein
VITQPPVEPGRRARVVVASGFEGWSDAVQADFADNSRNADVGSTLLSTGGRVRVWSIHLEPGERLGAHRHTLDYFWTALTAGHSRQHAHDGSTRLVTYEAGETRHFDFGPGEYLVHDLENIGDTPLAFVTVEFRRADRSRSGPTHPITTGAHP